MSDPHDWWSAWAPYWHHLEDQHLDSRVGREMIGLLSGPVLVIGAGQGIVVQTLAEAGLEVRGVDADPEMVRLARERRGLDVLQADARDLPLDDGSFGSVVLASGVVDYTDDPRRVRQMLGEAARVLVPDGRLHVTFYSLSPTLEQAYTKMGVLRDSRYHLDRLFRINRMVRVAPRHCVWPIMEWSGNGFVRTVINWGSLGLNRPQELRDGNDRLDRVFDQAAAAGVDGDALLSCVPGDLPYRDEAAVSDLIDDAGLVLERMLSFEECRIAVCKPA